MNDLFDVKDWDFRAGIMRGDGNPTWQVLILAALLPWVLALLPGAI